MRGSHYTITAALYSFNLATKDKDELNKIITISKHINKKDIFVI